MMHKGLTPEVAETLALDGLAFVVADSGRLERFLRLTGLEGTTLRARASDPDVLRAVLDFLLTDDSLVEDFCREQGLEARDLHLAQRLLGGP